MAERSTISQATQFGKETTSGTAVAANRRLASVGLEVGIETDIKTRKPVGQKHKILTILGKEWVEADVSGFPVYTELPYVFSGLVGKAIRQEEQSGGTAGAGSVLTDGQVGPEGVDGDGTRWTFESSQFDKDAITTYTVEQGDSVRAHRFVYGMFTDFSLDFSREDVEFDGTMIGKRLEDGITMTAAPTQRAQIPVQPTDLSVYLDEAFGDIGDTKLTRVMSGNFSIGSRFAPVWVVDRAQPSYVAHVETEPEVTMTIKQQANAEGMENLVRLRGSETVFLRVEALGPRINGDAGQLADVPLRHELRIDMAGQITETNSLSDEDGVYGVEWGFEAVYNNAWGNAYRVIVITTTGSL